MILHITYTPRHFLIVGVKDVTFNLFSVEGTTLSYYGAPPNVENKISKKQQLYEIQLPPNRYGEPFLLSESNGRLTPLVGKVSPRSDAIDLIFDRERLYLKNPMGEKEPECESDHDVVGWEALKQWHSYQERTFTDFVIVPII